MLTNSLNKVASHWAKFSFNCIRRLSSKTHERQSLPFKVSRTYSSKASLYQQKPLPIHILKFKRLGCSMKRYYGTDSAAHSKYPPPNVKFASDGKRYYSRQEVSEHNTVDDAWIVIDDKVYNVTSWIEYHPGGEEMIKGQVGKDATEEFLGRLHSWRAHEVLDSLHIGYVREPKRFTGVPQQKDE